MKITLLKGFLLIGTFLCFGLAKAQTVSGTVSGETAPLSGADVINSGSPSEARKLNTRGFGISGNTDPLYIIDGVQTYDMSGLNYISPSNIKQLTVLKGSAAAIYGPSATNGVIMIMTNGEGYNRAFSKMSHLELTPFKRFK